MSKQKYLEIDNNYNFERVDIFLRVVGRLPNKKSDKLTKKIINKYIDLYKKNKLKTGAVPTSYLYDLIKSGKIKNG